MRQAYKDIRRTLRVLALALCLGMTLWSCVKDNRSGCTPAPAPTLKLMLVPQPTEMKGAIAAGDMKRAVVWIFDSKGEVAATWSVDNPEFNRAYDTKLALADLIGKRLVGWVNPDAPYTVTPGYTPTVASRATLDGANLKLNVAEGGSVTDKIPVLLYGKVETVVEPGEDMTVKIPFVLDTYDLTFNITGVPRNGNTYEVKIVDSNGSYDFNNNWLSPSPEFTYSDSKTIDLGPAGSTGDLQLSLRTLRIAEGRHPKVKVVNKTTGEVIFPDPKSGMSEDLIEAVKSADGNFDFSKKSVIKIDIKYTSAEGSTNTTIDVWINGWKLVLERIPITP